MAKKRPKPNPKRLILAITGLSLVAIGLLAVRLIHSDSSRYTFLYWNLVLAALAPLLAWWFVSRQPKYGWTHISQIGLLIAWLLFLPNSFYILTDFVHLRPTFEASMMYDIALLTSFTLCGLIFGYSSVYLIHNKLRQKLSYRHAWYAIAGVFLASSFAIYLGRFSRFNTWDVLLAPAGLLFDVSDRVVNPMAHTETYTVTATLFLLLIAGYWVVWEAAEYLRAQ